ncbi:hypothetical protein ABVT39_009417 [Epinephelus coioides]
MRNKPPNHYPGCWWRCGAIDTGIPLIWNSHIRKKLLNSQNSKTEQQPTERETEQRQTEQQLKEQEKEQLQTEQTEQHTEQQTENEQQQWPEQGSKSRVKCGAAKYRCIFKSEWTTTWPFITKGTLSTHYWCSVCRVENSCCHQGVTDVVRHINSKSHQDRTTTGPSIECYNRPIFSVLFLCWGDGRPRG